MRSFAAAVVLACLPAGAVAQSQVELSVGGGVGSSFTRRAPFALDGQTYGGPYRTCPEGIAAGLCLQAGASDLAFALETHYSSLAVVGLEARRGVGGPFLAGVGVLGGLALRSQRILTADTVRSMKPGSIIVDLAADGGGNCELSKPGETVRVNGVTILAPLNLPATVPFHASLLFSRNLTAFVEAFTRDKAFQLNRSDDIQQGALITHAGEVTHARTRDALQKVTA